jgi:general secretion pathway protein M
MDKLKTKWNSLTNRERFLVSICTAVVFVGIIYYALVSPLLTSVSSSEQQADAQQKLLIWMRPRVNLLQNQSSSTVTSQTVTASELLPTVDARLKQADFASSVSEISQTADSGVRVALTNVPFDDLVTWLSRQWQRSKIQVSDIDVQKTEKVGIVNVTLTLVTS